MHQHSEYVRRCLETLDVSGMRRLWDHVAPHLPRPKTDAEYLIALHMARTQTSVLKRRDRYYSHRWLVERGLPSQLPDYDKPSADRMYPTTVEAVGISCNARGEIMRQVVPLVRNAMEEVVLDSFANGDKDPDLMRSRMLEARSYTVKKLVGVLLNAVGR